VTSPLAALTALLGERLRSSLPGYATTLAPHAALGSPSSLSTRAASAVVVTIADPALELVAWVQQGDPDEEPWSDRVVEIRVVLRATEEGMDSPPGEPGETIAAMVGDSIGFDDDLPLDEVLDAVRVLLFEELPLEIAEGGPAAQQALMQAMRVHLNDPI
jgi:hypothetical protein